MNLKTISPPALRPVSRLRFKADALDRLVAAGRIREIDREHVTFFVRKIVHPPVRPDDPLPRNAVGNR